MTDNRTTELRAKLTERGIEYETNDHMGACETSWNGFTVMQLTPSAKLIMTVTPEQAIAATLGSGALTAEQVRECVQRVYYEGYNDGSVHRAYGIEETDWQAIADELNAELGSGTCEVECYDDGVDEGMDGEWFSYAPPTWYLSCGHTAQGEKPNFCPVCGKRCKYITAGRR